MVALTSGASVTAAYSSAALAIATRGDSAVAGEATGWVLLGMAAYLTLIGLLGFTVAFLLRSLLFPLAAMLILVLVVSPLVASRSEFARWLPDQAGMLMYQPPRDAILSPLGGAAVLAGWVLVTAAVSWIFFSRRDASP